MFERDWQAEIALLKQRNLKARAILGVSEEAGRAEIHRAFRQACLAHHPDVNSGDADSARRFPLICCAYKLLTEGKECPALDHLPTPVLPDADSGYRLDNPWGYWCWWREKYFPETTTG